MWKFLQGRSGRRAERELGKLQGTITDVADTAGNKLQHYVYSAFGTLLGIQDANANEITNNPILNTSFTYSGREKDSESGYFIQ